MKAYDPELLKAEGLVSREYEFDKWRKEIPFIELPEGYQFKLIPNWCGSIVRFLAKKKDSEHSVSIYLDCYDKLGLFGEPYWEVYPVDGDTYRCAMGKVNELTETIVRALNEVENE